jgi:ElaB/YqjD/DUF883 family membrane-anchored ribosome-binding protein
MQQPPYGGGGGESDLRPDSQPLGTTTIYTTQEQPQSQGSGQSGAGAAASGLGSDVKQLGSTAADRLHSEVDARKDTAVSQANSVSSAIQRTAGDLGDDAPAWLKSTLQQGAEQMQRFASSLEQKDSRQLLNDVQSFARERPGTFLAACAAAGFAAARILKAGGAQSGASSQSGAQYPTSDQPAFGTSDEPAFGANSPGELV